jgi:UDP-N-acetylmuramate dehydrogenase
VLDREGRVRNRKADEYQVGYRQVNGPADEWFLAGTFRFHENFATSIEKMKALVAERKEKQPLGLPSCGSVFRNPPDDHAARLIEAAGLKGFKVGGAIVSEKHANFIINESSATAADIEALIDYVQAVVGEKHGVHLQREVHIIGEPLTDSHE